MAVWDFLGKSADFVRNPLTPQEARSARRTFQFRQNWQCKCGAELTIRAKEDRSSGPSNFVPYPEGHRHEGHSQVMSGALTWDGLAEERGWQTRPTKCPACVAGVSVAKYKELRRG